jgi:hypothetical protein
MRKVYRQCNNVEAVEVEGEWILYHAGNQTVTKLNETAGFLWTLLRHEMSVADIIELLSQSGMEAASSFETEINACVEQLAQIGVVEYGNVENNRKMNKKQLQ